MMSLPTYLRDLNAELFESIPMRNYTTFKVGGSADLIDVDDAASLCTLIGRLREDAIPFLLIGSGSNLLIADEGLPGVVLRLDPKKAAITRVDDTTLCCDAGLSLAKLSRQAQKLGLSGLEFACGIPGSVGGGVYMNAGAYGGEMKDVVTEVTVLFQDGTCKVVPANELDFSYRHSGLMANGGIVLSATVKLTEGDGDVIDQKMDELLTARRDKQPLEYPSAGSFFKRPPSTPDKPLFAGKLVQDAGMKGYRVGDAQVSEKHSGFVINRGNATCEELKQLEKDVRTKVFETFGVTLEPEVRLLGTTWLK